MLRRLIIFLVRRRLGLRTYERFRFVGQKSNAVYYFTKTSVMKYWRGQTMQSGVSVNWLLNKDCKIERV